MASSTGEKCLRRDRGRRVLGLRMPARVVAAAWALFLCASSPPSPAAAYADTVEGSRAAAALPREPSAEADAYEFAPGYPWRWPVNGPRAVTEPFRAPAHAYGPGHRGMDMMAATGAEVHAPAEGVIAFAGAVAGRPLLTIDHGGGFITTLEPVRTELRPGESVEAGAVIGVVDAGGHTPRGSVHVGVRLHGEYINPHPLFGTPPRAVLLPCCG